MKVIKKETVLLILLILSIVIAHRAYGDDCNKEDGTYLNLSVTEIKQVEPDLLIASLRYEVESESAKIVQNKINQIMKKALLLAEKTDELIISTERYSVYKYTKPAKKGVDAKETWKGSQTIVIKGKSTEDILVLSGQLQEMGLLMSDLHYEVSLEKIEEVRTSIMESAINKLLSRAKKTASIIGAKKVKVNNINIDGDNRYPQPYQGLMRATISNMSEAMSAPVSSPGKTDITLTISATMLLKN
ncbi:MAG: SIMPL domain-containing protein [Rickettsiaceae bacterium]